MQLPFVQSDAPGPSAAAGDQPVPSDSRAGSDLPDPLRQKLLRCERDLRDLGSVLVAFSAGVDSTFLLALAVRALGPGRVLAGMGVSASLAERERQAGSELASRLGVELLEVATGELANRLYAENGPDRCFHCKTDLFERLNAVAAERGLRAVVSGANADDRRDYRPGLEAGRLLGVRNPLMEAGLTKEEIRLASRAMGLPTWDKPAMACLASRVPYGQGITAERLARIEQAEYVLRDLGFADCRVRDHGPVARIEVPAGRIADLLEHRTAVVDQLKRLGYAYVAADLEGFRSGSMNETLSGPAERRT